MSLWYESLGESLYDCGNDLEKRTRCILYYLSMPVPRMWWEKALQAGGVPNSYIGILRELRDELLETLGTSHPVSVSVLIALPFTRDNSEARFEADNDYREYTLAKCLADAERVLEERPDLVRLGKAIKKALLGERGDVNN
jgi:hypothetical protein